MKIFNLDCHISVIADLKQIFENIGHEVTSWSVSGHNWVFNREPSKVDIVNQHTWMSLSKEMCDSFYERYKDELSEYDAFLCTYPPAFSMIYEKFNKPIILQIPIRYEVPFHNNGTKWNMFNEYLRNGIDDGMIIPVANSEYDKKYFEFFVNRPCDLIPNICEYTNTKWNPIIDKFLYYSRLPINLDNSLIINKSSLGRYEWSDIAKYKGIVMIPYNCSTMSIFEYYTANIPLFVPSKDFMKQLYSQYNNYVLSELTWNKTFGHPQSSVIECDRTNDPNMYNDLSIMGKWMELSDFYNEEWMPHITYFDSFEEMDFKLRNSNLFEISDKMKKFNDERKRRIYKLWEEKFNKINEKFSNR